MQLIRAQDISGESVLRKLSLLPPSRFAAALAFLRKKRLLESSARSSNATLRLNPSAGYVAGVDIGGSNLRIALADLGGSILGKWSTSTRQLTSPPLVVSQIRRGVDYLLREARIPRRSLLSIAAGAPGMTDSAAGVVIATSYLKGWRDVPFRDHLESSLGIPAAIENDVKVAAIGEHWLGAARGLDNFVFLAIGTGIAAGVFVNGVLIHGTDSSAGEVGYMLVPGTSESPVKTGMPGPLEGAIGGEGIRQQWLQGLRKRGNGHPRSLTATEIFDYAVAGDLRAREILDRTARMLAYTVYNMSLVLNSSLFVLGGGVGMSPVLREATRSVLFQYDEPVRPKITLSSLGPDAQLMGSIRLALDLAEARLGLRA